MILSAQDTALPSLCKVRTISHKSRLLIAAFTRDKMWMFSMETKMEMENFRTYLRNVAHRGLEWVLLWSPQSFRFSQFPSGAFQWYLQSFVGLGKILWDAMNIWNIRSTLEPQLLCLAAFLMAQNQRPLHTAAHLDRKHCNYLASPPTANIRVHYSL